VSWTIRVESDANALDVDIYSRVVEVVARIPGELSDDIGRLVRFRRPLSGCDGPAVQAFLEGDEAQVLLARVQDGTGVDTLWSGDRLGTWTEDAFEAACALHSAVEGMAP